jgi:hypothetical protein
MKIRVTEEVVYEFELDRSELPQPGAVGVVDGDLDGLVEAWFLNLEHSELIANSSIEERCIDIEDEDDDEEDDEA